MLAHDDEALGPKARHRLPILPEAGDDDTASAIICDVVARLHSHKRQPSFGIVVPLDRWFRGLEPSAAQYGGVLKCAAETARCLLTTPQAVVILHGDIHYGNILDFGVRGWLAIDLKGLKGERGFDYANFLCNPDHKIATTTGRLGRQANVVAEAVGLPRTRLLQSVLAYTGLSAAWTLNTGRVPK